MYLSLGVYALYPIPSVFFSMNLAIVVIGHPKIYHLGISDTVLLYLEIKD